MKIFVRLFACIALLAALGAPAFASVRAVIDKSEQRMRVYDGDTLLYDWPASTGLMSSYTPTGTFHPIRFYPGTHASGKYGKNMIWSVYYKGIRAVHGVDDPSDLAALGKWGTSMGCTHLSPTNAKIFYDIAQRQHVTIKIQD